MPKITELRAMAHDEVRLEVQVVSPFGSRRIAISDVITSKDVAMLDATVTTLEALGAPGDEVVDLASRLRYLLSFTPTQVSHG